MKGRQPWILNSKLGRRRAVSLIFGLTLATLLSKSQAISLSWLNPLNSQQEKETLGSHRRILNDDINDCGGE